MWFQNLIGRIKRLIKPERRARTSRPVPIFSGAQLYTRYTSEMMEWCRAFNRRNGWRVPERSVRSIYLTTRRKVRS